MLRLRPLLLLLGAIASVWLATDASWDWRGQTSGGARRAAALAPRTPMQGQIVVSEQNPAWLTYSDGKPFFMCGPGDPEGFLYRGALNADGTRDGDQMALIEKLKSSGANSVYVMAVRSHGGDGDKTQNPFIDHDPSKNLNELVLDQWETWFTEMDANGIVIFFFIYDDSARIWNTGDNVGRYEKHFLQSLVKRFKHHKNLIWVIAEEYEERYSHKRISRIAEEIRAADEFGHPIAVHKLSGLDFSEFADDPYIDQFAIQFGNEDPQKIHQALVSAWTSAGGRYNLNFAEGATHQNRTATRLRSWAAAMAGAYTMILGMDIANTAVPDLEDCGRLIRFMVTTDFVAMGPSDELAYAGTEFVLAGRGDSYIAYASRDSRQIGLRNMIAGTFHFTWFDPVTGNKIEWRNIDVQAGDQVWDKPPAIGDEVAVYVRRDQPNTSK